MIQELVATLEGEGFLSLARSLYRITYRLSVFRDLYRSPETGTWLDLDESINGSFWTFEEVPVGHGGEEGFLVLEDGRRVGLIFPGCQPGIREFPFLLHDRMDLGHNSL